MECPLENEIKTYSSPTVVENDKSAQGSKDQYDNTKELPYDNKGLKYNETFHDASPDKDTFKKQPVTNELYPQDMIFP